MKHRDEAGGEVAVVRVQGSVVVVAAEREVVVAVDRTFC